MSGTSLMNDFGDADDNDILAQLENLDINDINENDNKPDDVLSNFQSLTLSGDNNDALNLNSLTAANDLLTGEPMPSSVAQSASSTSNVKEESADLLF